MTADQGQVFNRGNKAISALGQGLNKTWFLGVVPQGCAEFVDGFVETTLEIDKGVLWPQLSAELVSRHDFARAPQEQHQHLKRLFLEIDLGALPAQLSGSSVKLEETKTDQLR